MAFFEWLVALKVQDPEYLRSGMEVQAKGWGTLTLWGCFQGAMGSLGNNMVGGMKRYGFGPAAWSGLVIPIREA